MQGMLSPQSIPSLSSPVRRPARSPIPALAQSVSAIVARHGSDEAAICTLVARALSGVVEDADWLPGTLRAPHPGSYRRELLYEAPDRSFSIGCFVWGAGQHTPIHDHRAWCVMGVAVGAVGAVSFYPLQSGMLVPGQVEEVPAGACSWVHPEGGDIHRVGALGAETSVSIHVYGSRFSAVCRNRYHPDGSILKP
jgi:predicted metal-dependent enzyme (double-stranded beta helix superfamily)